MAAIIGGIMKAEPKKHLWQFLDGPYNNSSPVDVYLFIV